MHTYIIKSTPGELYKIGRSKDVKKRLSQIRGSMSFIDLNLVHEIGYDCETVLHSYFSEKRVKGEWFSLDASDIAYIKNKDWRELSISPIEADHHYLEFMENSRIDIRSVRDNLSISGLRLFGYACSHMDKKNLVILTGSSLKEHFNYKSVGSIYNSINELIETEIIFKTNRKQGEFMVNPVFALNNKVYRYLGSKLQIDMRFDRSKDKLYWFREVLNIQYGLN